MRTYPAETTMLLNGQALPVPDLPSLPTPDMYDDLQEAYFTNQVEWDDLAVKHAGKSESEFWFYAALNLLDHPDVLRPDPLKPVLLPSRQALDEGVDE